MFGELKIVPSGDLGEIGQHEGQATTFDWKWYYSAVGLLIWLVLTVATLVPKANHNRHVLWILVPLVILNLAWLVFKKLMGIPSSTASQFDAMFQSMVVGTASLWLMAGYLNKLSSVVRFLVSFAIVLIVVGLGMLSYHDIPATALSLFAILLVLLIGVLLVSMIASGLLCRRRYKPFRFMLWLALWILVGGVAVFCFTYVIFILAIVPGSSRPHLSQLILSILMPGVIFAAFLYAINLPFMVLGFVHPFFRERLCACLGLQTAPSGPPSQVHTGESIEVTASGEAKRRFKERISAKVRKKRYVLPESGT